MRNVVGFINVTRRCNVDCHRCYLTKEHRRNDVFLTSEILTSFLASPFWTQSESSLFIWEGGESVIAGPERLREFSTQIKHTLPASKQTMVTNMYSVPDWLINIAHEFYGSRIETTFALGKKYSIDGSDEKYIRRFKYGLDRIWDAGITSPVNVEVNVETINAGPKALVDFMLSTRCKMWEFDLSIDFEAFLRHPEYDTNGYPILKSTASYYEYWSYLSELKHNYYPILKDQGILIGAFEQVDAGHINQQFNVQREMDFLTLNPDGTVTTNPLFSDMKETYLGSLVTSQLDKLLRAKPRIKRMLAEHNRTKICRINCRYYGICRGGPSHAPVYDGSGECVGGYSFWRGQPIQPYNKRTDIIPCTNVPA